MRLGNPLFVVVVSYAACLVGCGGGMQAVAPPPAPTFTSTPGTAAAEGVEYTYQVAATDPLGKTVSFALGSGPAGATLTENTLTWTPTATESRLANNFSITATTAEGGTAGQTWAVTPVGTVHITRVDTRWTANGPETLPFDWTMAPGAAGEVAAQVPQEDGTFLRFTGTGSSDGTYAIPNVPGGYYWLQIAPLNSYWTSASNFDFGTDLVGTPLSGTTTNALTTFEGTVNGLDPWVSGDYLDLNLDNGLSFGVSGSIATGATSGDLQGLIGGNVDFTAVKSAVIGQMETLQLGSLSAVVLGPTLQLTNLALTNGGTNTLGGTLAPSPENALSLKVQGSDWAALYNNAAAAPATPYDTSLDLAAQAYFTGGVGDDAMPSQSPIPPLFATDSTFAPGLTNFVGPGTSCGSEALISSVNVVPPLMGQAPILTDVDFGSFQYGDPFPGNWLRLFFYCQEAVVNIPDASSNSPIVFVLADGQITAPPTGPVTPLVSVVQSPMINGVSLFTASTLSTGTVSLSWTAPNSNTEPTGYDVELFVKTTITLSPPAPPPNTFTGYLRNARLYTTKTNATLPFSLPPGQEFLVEITADLDGRANFESSPLRSGLPVAHASVISAVMTVSAAAPAVQQGNRAARMPAPSLPRLRSAQHSDQISVPNH